MVLHQEFDADTKERIYIVTFIDDQSALNYHEQSLGNFLRKMGAIVRIARVPIT